MKGDPNEVAIIQRIFHEFVELGYSEYRIAERLNSDGIESPGGKRWRAGSVLNRLRNEVYVGTIVYNRTSSKLKTPKRRNPTEEWIRSTEAFDGLVALEQFLRAQELLEQRRQKYEPEYMLRELESLWKKYGIFKPSLLRMHDAAPSSQTYANHFGSFDAAFQQLHLTERDRAKLTVQDEIAKQISQVLNYSDFLVLNQKLSLSIQPAVPVPHGYTNYWPIQPDSRRVIDITLGVLLSEWIDPEILGYVALPRGFGGSRTFRFGATSMRTELFGRTDLSFLQTLL